MKYRAWSLVGLLGLTMLATATAEPPVVSHDDSFSKEGLFKADVSKLKDTQLIAHPDNALVPNKNVIWCGTLQLAWNKAIDLVGEKLRFSSPGDALLGKDALSPSEMAVNQLNRMDFTDQNLDADSYVALADFERNNVEDEIRSALEKTFHGAASPELIPDKPESYGPDDFIAYAYLYKNLSFAQPFADNEPLDFGTAKVKNFGFLKNSKQLPEDVFDQVAIFDYKSRDNFIIKLKTKSPEDELIVAKVPPASTLQATMTDVLQRVTKSQPVTANADDTLAIPKLNFDLRRDFSELEGLVLQPSANARIKSKLVVTEVKQLVRFQLNENGAILKSEAAIAMRMSAIVEKPEPHFMIFDKPFLILMKRANSDKPYFAMWVGNASLLVPAVKP